jgi:hypothetical protein
MGTWGAKQIQVLNLNADTDGDNLILSPPTGKPNAILVVTGYMISISAAGTIILRSTDNGNLYLEVKDPGASYAGSFDAPAIITPPGEGLEVVNPAGVDCNGHIAYFWD